MRDLRVLLRYGIVGYMMLFFDLIFLSSYFDLREFLSIIKGTQLGIIVGIMGIPTGWLCYQIWDQCMNKYWIPKAINIKRIRKWEEEIRDRLGVSVDKNLPDHTIKVIANISLGYFMKNDQTESSTSYVSSDPRRLGHFVYSDSQQARGVMLFVLPYASYFTYLLIAVYIASKYGLSYALCPIDKTLYLISLFLPVLVSLISVWGFHRVHEEQRDFAWAILMDKENEIKRLIKNFYTAKTNVKRERS